MEDTAPRSGRRGRVLRWISLAMIVAGFAAAWGWLWLFTGLMRQQKVMTSVPLLFAGVVLLMLWLVLLSGLRLRTRLGLLGLAAVLVVGAVATLRVRGVSGDLIPVFAWRWTAEPESTLPVTPEPEVVDPSETTMLIGLADYPQYLGPGRDATLADPGVARDWSVTPPRLVWRQPIGAGWSGFAVSGRRAVTQEQRGDDELVTCYDVSTGRLQWSHGDKARYEETIAGIGPRATPTVAGDAVYAVGATGILNALSLDDGRSLWSTNIFDDGGGRRPEWGFSGSPLVVDDVVVINAGGPRDAAIIAYDRVSGERVWSGGFEQASYASPMTTELAGRSQIVMVNRESVTGHALDSGDVLWRFEWPGLTPKVAQPLPLPNDRLLVSAGYGLGAHMLRVTSSDDEAGGDDDAVMTVESIWRSPRLKAKFTNIVTLGEHVYGLDDGVLTCVDLERGRRVWKGGRYGHGQVILLGDALLVLAEDGELALVEATSEAFREITSFQALDGKTWNPPTLAGRYILVRNDREAACYELPLR